MILTYTKAVNSTRLKAELEALGVACLRIDTVGTTVNIEVSDSPSPGLLVSIDSVVSSHVQRTTREIVGDRIRSAVYFGRDLIQTSAAENVLLGITELGLTGHVRKTLREVKDALDSGSLYDAIIEIKSINTDTFDEVILTPARLLQVRNTIEAFLQVPLATSWNDDETWL